MPYEFEPVKLGKEAQKHKRQAAWKHVRKTLLYMLGGVAISLVYLHLSEGPLTIIHPDEITSSAFVGAFMGFFLTNSPCARGRC